MEGSGLDANAGTDMAEDACGEEQRDDNSVARHAAAGLPKLAGCGFSPPPTLRVPPSATMPCQKEAGTRTRTGVSRHLLFFLPRTQPRRSRPAPLAVFFFLGQIKLCPLMEKAKGQSRSFSCERHETRCSHERRLIFIVRPTGCTTATMALSSQFGLLMWKNWVLTKVAARPDPLFCVLAACFACFAASPLVADSLMGLPAVVVGCRVGLRFAAPGAGDVGRSLSS